MNSSEIARLSARVEITGLDKARSGLRGLESSLESTARAGDTASIRHASAATRTSAAYSAAAAKSKASMAALARYSKLAAGAGIVAGGAALAYGVKLNASFESTQASFATFLGSVQKAKKFTEELRSVSSKSPLKLTDYAQGAQLLLGFGVSAKKTIPILGAVNKAVVATGKGSEEMMQITRALGQIQAKGKASAEELMQLAEAGAPVNKILQKELKLTGEQVANIGDEGIKSGAVLSAIARGWNKQFGPAYKNAAGTFNFQMASARKSAEQFLRIATEPVFNVLSKTVLPAVNDEFAKLIAVIDNPNLSGAEKWRKVGAWFDETGKSVGRLANKAIPKIAAAFDKALPVISKVIERVTPIVAEALGKLAVAAIPLAVKAGAGIAKGLVKGFAESDWLGKIALATILFKAFGGFAAMNAAGIGVGTIVAGGLRTGLTAGLAAFNLAQSFDRGLLTSGAAGFGAAGASLATSILGALARAIPIVAGAFAIGEILTSAIKGEWTDAFTKLGGAGIGAAIGFIAGGPVGAALGAGLGVLATKVAPKLWEGIFGGGQAEEKTLAERLKESSERVAAALKNEKAQMQGMAKATGAVVEARRRQRAATENLANVESSAAQVKRRYGAQSAQAAVAEARLGGAKRRSARASEQLKKAESVQGVVRTATKQVLKASIAEQKENLGLLKDERAQKLRNLRSANKYYSGTQKQTNALNAYNRSNSKVNKAQKDYGNTLIRAANQIGPKFAKSLKNMTTNQVRFGRSFVNVRQITKSGSLSMTNAIERVGTKSKTSFRQAQGAGENYAAGTGRVRRRVNQNMRAMPPVQIEATNLMQSDFTQKADVITGYGSPQSKRRGGIIRNYRAGGLVPAMLSPGELLIEPNGRKSVVPGTPTARDSVFMHLPENTAVATFDGQARLAAGEPLNSVMRTQAPHFAAGGIVKPTVSGGSPAARGLANKGISRLHGFATKRLKWLRAHSLNDLDDVVRLGAKYGLQVTSGNRPGDDGWHGQNRARDLSNGFGPTPQMLAFAKFLYQNHSQKLLELIYTPLGAAVDNYRKTGTYAEADHYDHVHVAMRKGGLAEGCHGRQRKGRRPMPGFRQRKGVRGYGIGGRIREMTDALIKRGYSPKATAGIIGNAYREAGPDLNPGSVGTGGGGLFGFTTSPISLADLQAAAARKGVDWKNIDFQIGFMDDHMPASLKKQLNASGSVAGATELFMDEWERPGIPALDDRLAGANIAWRHMNARRKAKLKRSKASVRGARRLWSAIKKHGTTKAGRKRARLAARAARGAVKATQAFKFDAATARNTNSRRFRRKGFRDVQKHVRQVKRRKAAAKKRREEKRRRQRQKKNGNNGGDPGSPAAPTKTGWNPNEPISRTNFPGTGKLPAGIREALGQSDLTWSGKRTILDRAEADAAATETKVDDAAVQGEILRMETIRRNEELARSGRLSTFIAKSGGMATVKKLTGKIKNLAKRQRKAAKVAAGKIRKAARRRDKALRNPNLSAKARKAINKRFRREAKKAGAPLRRLRDQSKAAREKKNKITGAIAARDEANANAADATNAINSANDSLDELGVSETTDGSGDAADLIEELKALREEIAEQNRMAAKTQSLAGGEIGRAVRDWLSGELVGKGFAGVNNNVRY